MACMHRGDGARAIWSPWHGLHGGVLNILCNLHVFVWCIPHLSLEFELFARMVEKGNRGREWGLEDG